jgi:hypothetical protein
MSSVQPPAEHCVATDGSHRFRQHLPESTAQLFRTVSDWTARDGPSTHNQSFGPQQVVNDLVSDCSHIHQVTPMSGNKRPVPFPISAAFQTGPVVEPDADYDARSTTWAARGPAARQPRATITQFALVAGVVAVSAAIVYAFVRYRRQSGADGAKPTANTSRDHDVSKGAIEDERPSEGTNAPGLDSQGLPNDERAITEDALGARLDGTQG